MAGLEGLFGSVQFGSFIGYGYYAVIFIAVLAVVIPIVYFIMILIWYNQTVVGFEIVGDAVQLFRDKAALLKDKDTKKVFQFKLLKKKAVLPPPPANSYIFDRRGRKAVMLAQISPTDFVYIKPQPSDIPLSVEDKKVVEDLQAKYSYVRVSEKITKKEVNLVPIEQDTLFWYVNMLERQNEKYANKPKWYENPYILGLGCMAICLIILIITFKYAGSWQATAKETALELVEQSKGLVGQVVS